MKTLYLSAQEELDALLWVCFTPSIIFLIFGVKKNLGFFFAEKKSAEKSRFFFAIILEWDGDSLRTGKSARPTVRLEPGDAVGNIR